MCFIASVVVRETVGVFNLALDYMHAVVCCWALADMYYQAGRFEMGSPVCSLHLQNGVGPSYRRFCQSVPELVATKKPAARANC